MDSKVIGTFKQCDQLYYMNCSDVKDYNNYCSKECEDIKEGNAI